MTTRSLGSLTLDLIARIGGFRDGMDQASRIASSKSREISQSVSRNVSSGFRDAEKSISDFTTRFLSLAAAYTATQKAFSAADAWTGLNNRIRIVTNGTEEFNQAQSSILSIARETRQSLSSTAELYQRIAQNQDELKLSGQGVADIVSTISKTLVISGTSASSAQAALVQLGQAFASGVLRGEELNSVLEQAPALAKALADGLGVSVGQLRSLGAAGELTADAVIKALQSQAEAVDETFSKVSQTIGQGIEVAKTNLTETVGRLDDATGASQALSAAIVTLSSNLAPAAAAFSAFASVKIAQNISERARAFALERAAIIDSTKAQLSKAQATELATRVELRQAQAAALAAAGTKAEIQLRAQAAAATLAHRQATIALTAAQAQATAATGALSAALRGAVGFLGGPAGIAFLVASTAASWLLFRDNNSAANKALIDFNGTLDDSISKFNELNKQQQLGEIKRLSEEAASSFDELSDSVQKVQASLSGTVRDTDALFEFGRGARELLNQFREGSITADQFSQGISDLRAETDKSSTASQYLKDRLSESEAQIGTIAREYARQNGLLQDFRGAQNNAAVAVDDTTDALRAQERALAAGQKSLNDFIGKLQSGLDSRIISNVRKTQGEFAALQVEVGNYIIAAGGASNLTQDQRTAINDYLEQSKRLIDQEKAFDESRKSSRSGRSRKEEISDYERLTAQFKEQIALFGESSNAAKVSYDIQAGAIKGLTDAQKESLIQQAETLDALAKEKELRDQVAEALREETEQYIAQKQAISDYLGDLEFENELYKLNNAERERAIALRRLGIEAGSEEDANLQRLIAEGQALRDQAEVLDTLRGEASNFIVDIASGAKSLKDAFKDALDNIHQQFLRIISERLVERLLGAGGTSGGGQAGGFFASILGSIGGRAGGGSVKPWSMYQVNETGMEGISVNGRDYLMTGSKGGIVSANPRTGGINQTVNIQVAGRIDRRTEEQIARSVGRESQRGLARTGA